MRIFKCRVFNEEYDLDDPKTYEDLPQNVEELRNLMFKEIGYYYCYVTHFNRPWDDSQENRVEDMIEDFCNNERKNYKNILWYQEHIFLFQNETENMC